MPGPISNYFQAWYINDTAPSQNPGTLITPGQNTFPTYAEILAGASVLDDCYEVLVNINSNSVSTANRDTLVNIGVDPAGGTSWTTLIPNLLASCAGSWAQSGNGGFGVTYRFPLFVKAGSSIAAQASINNATVGNLRVLIGLSAKPSRPDMMRYGTYIEAIGAVTASSRGTLVTAGLNGSDGTYTSLGTTSKHLWGWQVGFGTDDATMSNNAIYADLAVGNGTNFNTMLYRQAIMATSAEGLMKPPIFFGGGREVAAVSTIYGRLANGSASNDTNVSMIAYGVGG